MKSSLFLPLLILFSAMFIGGSAHAQSSCEDVFRAAARAPVRIDKKFSNEDLKDHFISSMNSLKPREVRAWVETAQLNTGASAETHEFFSRLRRHGLKIETNVIQGPHHLIFQGSLDVVMAALRHSAVTRITKVKDGWLNEGEWTFFSKVKPRGDEAEFKEKIDRKFRTPVAYTMARRYFLAEPGVQFQTTVTLKGLGESNDFAQFMADTRDIGLTSNIDELGNQTKKIEFKGPMDGIFALVRHPAVVEVGFLLEYEPPADAQAEYRAEKESRDRIERDMVARQTVPPRLGLPGEPEFIGMIYAKRNSEIPSLIQIGRSQGARFVIQHEARTARDYAAFVRRNFDQDFGYLSEYEGKSVPLFDGMVLHQGDHGAVANVSLKYDSFPLPGADLRAVQNEVRRRVKEFQLKQHRMKSVVDWFRVTNALRDNLAGMFYAPLYKERIEHASTLLNLYGLFPKAEAAVRPTRIVVDVRDRGYSFDDFKSAAFQHGLVEALKFSAKPGVTLTFLWNDRQVVDILPDGVKVYE